jgi:hypothetical protein
MSKRRGAAVIDLAEVRTLRRVAAYQRKIAHVLDSNRRAIARLFSTGALFSRQGARVGRDLLLAHQHMLRVVALLHKLSQGGQATARRPGPEAEAVFDELDQLLDRTTILTHRTGDYLARLRME